MLVQNPIIAALDVATVEHALKLAREIAPAVGAFKIGSELFNELYAQGVLVRDVSSYPMLERVLRVTVGTPEQNDKFLAALDTALPKEVKR